MTLGLFDDAPAPYAAPEAIAPGAALLRGFALEVDETLLRAVEAVTAAAPQLLIATDMV